MISKLLLAFIIGWIMGHWQIHKLIKDRITKWLSYE